MNDDLEKATREFWNNFKTVQRKSNYTQTDISLKIGLTGTTLQQWIRRNTMPNLFYAYKIAQLLNTSLDFLMTGTGLPTLDSTEAISKPDNSKLAARLLAEQIVELLK